MKKFLSLCLFITFFISSGHAQKINFPHELLDGLIDSTTYAKSVKSNWLKICRLNHFQFADSNKIAYGQKILLPNAKYYRPYYGESQWRAAEYYTILYYIRRYIKSDLNRQP